MVAGIRRGALQAAVVAGLLALWSGGAGRIALAQAAAEPAVQRTQTALLLSDFHFDPFHDPGKVRQLVDAPVSEWGEILGAPASANQETALAGLQRVCQGRGFDTSYALLQSSLRAVRAQASGARFVTVSGDMIAHNFACRFAVLVPGKTPSEYAGFVEKTMAFVMEQLRGAMPEVPVYAALGNNDTGCGDYRIDAHGPFLAAAGKIMLQGLPASVGKEERARALTDFAAGGYYSVTMAAPMRRTRLIVLNDVFMSRNYATCGGNADRSEGAKQLEWLRSELDAARQQKQRVWVLGHIPPGVDVYGTVKGLKDVCSGAAPAIFLSSEELGEILVEHADVVRLGIFAHTHMDELRLLGPEGKGSRASAKEMVAVKMVASISPVNGNSPSFTVAQVDPASAQLMDYSVFIASNKTGIQATWSKEYMYSQTYGEAAFAPPEVAQLMEDFRRDPDAKTKRSQAFIRYFVAGDTSSLIKPLWPEYVCALSRVTGKGFSDCACSAASR
ncbi:MAG: metallophosphoesterase [Edaphobacter sp.]